VTAPSAPRDAYDIVVVGAGPAGMAAAAEAAAAGSVSVLVVDDNPAAGGQVWRAAGAGPLADGRVLGKDYAAGGGAATRAFAAAAGVDRLPRAQVWHLDDRLELGLALPDGRGAVVRAGRVVLATGALERPVPVPGWTLPGVMSVGAAQTALKAHAMVPDGRYALAGCGPLLWLYAAQTAAAGAPPALVLDTTPRANLREAARHLPAFLRSPYARKGVPLLFRARRAAPVVGGVDGLRVVRDGAAGLRLIWTRGGRGEDSAPFDSVLLHHGVTPNLNLARAAGCELDWQDLNACFAPRTDGWGRTTVPGVLLAGDGAGIGGAEAAALGGRIAALAALAELGAIPEAERDARSAPLRAERARWLRGRPFLDALYRPAPQFRSAAPDAVACRCEEVTGAQVAEAARLGATGPNQLKAWLRCGMGPCQGRMCGLTVTETIAAARGATPAEVGYLRLRTPVRPVTLAQVASLPRTDAERRAVERL
jgi:NADPH-dependent 2,4-dienoyl-CoA reductase/sulfur reductase-like enzyme